MKLEDRGWVFSTLLLDLQISIHFFRALPSAVDTTVKMEL
jgi:hypothetical protein